MITIEVDGVKQTLNSLNEINNKQERVMAETMKDVVSIVADTARRNVNKAPGVKAFKRVVPTPVLTKEGRKWYKENVGNTEVHPRVVTEKLRASIDGILQSVSKTQVVGVVGSIKGELVDYALKLEYGIGRGIKYPWLYPAVEKNFDKAKKMFEVAGLKIIEPKK